MKKQYVNALWGVAFALLGTMAVQAYDFEVDGIYYNVLSLDDMTCEVTYKEERGGDYSFPYAGIIHVPETVTYSGRTFTVTAIGEYAFYSCENLVEVTLPGTIISIGAYAFYDCTGLAEIMLPTNVTTIEEATFARCTSLSKVTLSPTTVTIEDSSFENCASLAEINISSTHITNIGQYAFENCTNLVEMTLPSTITNIGISAFASCTNLIEIYLPPTITDIGDRAFAGCESLKTVAIPTSLNGLANELFYGCSSLKKIIIPHNVSKIGFEVFENSGIDSCIIENGSEPIDIALTFMQSGFATSGGSFFKSNIKYLYLGRKFEFDPKYSWGSSPFYNMEHLEELAILELSIPNKNMIAMYDNDNDTYKPLPNFKKLTILPGGKLSIDWESDDTSDLVDFHNIEELSLEGTLSSVICEPNFFYIPISYSIKSAFPQIKHLKLNETVSQIGRYKFNGCATETIEINSQSLAIDENAFLNNSELTAIICKIGTPPTFNGDPGFSNQQYMDLPVYVPESALAAYQQADVWKNFWNIKSLDEIPIATEVLLSDSFVTLGKEETFQLAATVLPENTFDKTVIWSSSNEEVVTVSNAGLVEAVGVGTATITASCGDATATCEVIVKPAPSSIKLNYNSFTLGEGENFQLEATVLPEDAIDKTVTWSTSNYNVATVSVTGLVKANKAGTTTITARCGKVTATCKVTVEAVAREIELNEYSITLCDRSYYSSRDNEFQLEATVLPEDAYDKTVTWSSNNNNVAIVSETGFVEGVEAGTATITAKCGKVSSACRVTVKPGVSRIELNEEFVTLFVGETFQLRATVYPENAFYKEISWSVQNYTSDGVKYDAATVSETGLVRATKVGHAYIEARCGGKPELCFVTVTDNTGLETLLQDSDAEFAVYNVQGILVQQKCTPDELRNLPKGIYILSSEKGQYKVAI